MMFLLFKKIILKFRLFFFIFSLLYLARLLFEGRAADPQGMGWSIGIHGITHTTYWDHYHTPYCMGSTHAMDHAYTPYGIIITTPTWSLSHTLWDHYHTPYGIITTYTMGSLPHTLWDDHHIPYWKITAHPMGTLSHTQMGYHYQKP